jgi:hypothetical protein
LPSIRSIAKKAEVSSFQIKVPAKAFKLEKTGIKNIKHDKTQLLDRKRNQRSKVAPAASHG